MHRNFFNVFPPIGCPNYDEIFNNNIVFCETSDTHFDERWAEFRSYVRKDVLPGSTYALVVGVVIFLLCPISTSLVHAFEVGKPRIRKNIGRFQEKYFRQLKKSESVIEICVKN